MLARAGLEEWVRENPDIGFPVWPIQKGVVYIQVGKATALACWSPGGRARPEVVPSAWRLRR